MLHCDIAGEPVSVVTPFIFQRRDVAKGFSVRSKMADGAAEVYATESILAAVVYSNWSADTICTLVPIEFR